AEFVPRPRSAGGAAGAFAASEPGGISAALSSPAPCTIRRRQTAVQSVPISPLDRLTHLRIALGVTQLPARDPVPDRFRLRWGAAPRLDDARTVVAPLRAFVAAGFLRRLGPLVLPRLAERLISLAHQLDRYVVRHLVAGDRHQPPRWAILQHVRPVDVIVGH